MSTLPYALAAACACALLGLSAGKRLRERACALANWERAISALSASLSCSRAALHYALTTAGLESMARALEGDPCGGALGAFRALDAQLLPPLAREALEAAFSSLDTDTLQEQISALAHARKRLEALRQEAERKASVDGRLYRQLGCLAAVAALILLI